MVRHKIIDFSELWKSLPWKKFRRNLFRLQRRLFKAIQAEDTRRARNLQKLILKPRFRTSKSSIKYYKPGVNN